MEAAAVWWKPQVVTSRGARVVAVRRKRASFKVGVGYATAASRDGGERGGGWYTAEQAGRRAARTVVDKTQEVFSQVKRMAEDFQEENDVEDKVRRFSRAANQRIEEAGYEVKRNAGRLNRKYRFTQRAEEFVEYVKERVQAADSRFRIRQQVRAMSIDLRMKLPTYRRQLYSFLDTPLGKLLSTLVFVWFVLSGWIFRVFVLSMWLLPIAAPLLIGTIARNAIVEGACPNCKAQFIGSRSQVVVCRSCRNVVWQPRDNYSSPKEDPSIIDIDVDKD